MVRARSTPRAQAGPRTRVSGKQVMTSQLIHLSIIHQYTDNDMFGAIVAGRLV
jgi:hypothetical protein